MTCRQTPLRLFGSPDSANLVVRLALEELNLAYEFVAVDRAKREHDAPAYLQMNPQGLLPVLVDPRQDAPVFETGAILLHLVDRSGQLGPDPASPSRGRFLKWLFFTSNTLHADLRASFKPDRYMPRPDCRPAFIRALRVRIEQHFSMLEREYSASPGPYLLAADPTVIDFYIAACARWAQLYPDGFRLKIAPYSELRSMMGALEDRPAVVRACRLEHIEGAPFTAPRHLDLPGITD